MTVKHADKDLTVERFEAEVKEAEARMKVIQARVKARKAQEEMDEISGLTAAKNRVKKEIAAMKREAAEDYAATKREVEQEIEQLKADIERANERFTAWDEARERRFYARLDEAEARLNVWKAQARQHVAEQGIKRHDELATLEEKIALARARAAEARHARHTAQADAALEDAALHFDRAYDAAAGRYAKM